jgi:HlyD family secretion protein
MSGSQFDIPSLSVSGERNGPDGALTPPARPQDPRDALALPPPLATGARNRRWLIGLLAVGLLAFAYFKFWGSGGPQALYRVSPVERRAIRQTVEAFGSLDVVRRVLVPAPRPGQLSEIYVRRGTLVEAGQPLAKLDATGASAEVNATQTAVSASAAVLDRARAARTSAAEERARAERLLSRGLVSEASVTAARAAEAEANAAVRAAEAQRDLDRQAASGAKLRRDETTLRASVSGFVLSATEDVGMMVGPQTGPLFVITPPLTDLVLTVPVSEADIGLVRVGQSAIFSVSAHPDKRFPAQVDEIEREPQRTGSSVSYRVRLRVKNPDQLLLPGMTANVTLEIAEASEALAVREAALRFVPPEAGSTETPRSRVWKVTGNDNLDPVDVVVGLSDGAYTAVTPAPGFELEVGDVVAVGYAGSGRDGGKSKGGPGISLGSKP